MELHAEKTKAEIKGFSDLKQQHRKSDLSESMVA